MNSVHEPGSRTMSKNLTSEKYRVKPGQKQAACTECTASWPSSTPGSVRPARPSLPVARATRAPASPEPRAPTRPEGPALPRPSAPAPAPSPTSTQMGSSPFQVSTPPNFFFFLSSSFGKFLQCTKLEQK